jgi:polysaccharide deacetylase family protein (PEP-CTERM system associated)
MTAIRNAMTVDVEDYFQVQAFAHRVSRADWDGFPLRVEHSTQRILDAFAQAGTKATFFTLGWVAERFPALIRRIVAEGHELASHGWDHTRVFTQTPDAFRADIRRTKAVLEDLGGTGIAGYRAATFSINAQTMWAYPILAEEGYRYSSSINPIRHDLYGMPDASREPFFPQPDGVIEIPMTTVRLLGRNWPCSGGGYFRLLPDAIYRAGLGRVNRQGMPGIFYFHPWEIDADQPRIPDVGLKSRLRHYTNLSRMEGGLRALLRDFTWDRMDRVYAAVLADPPRAAAPADVILATTV